MIESNEMKGGGGNEKTLNRDVETNEYQLPKSHRLGFQWLLIIRSAKTKQSLNQFERVSKRRNNGFGQ